MAVLGVGGRLELKRELAEPCVITQEQLDYDKDVVTSMCPGFWTGDHIFVDCLPVDDGGLPSNPDGYASYFGSKWFLGPNRTQIDANTDIFYKTDVEEYPDGQFGDGAQFYCREGDDSGGDIIEPCKPGDWWIHVDELGQISFYTSRCRALAGCPDDRVNLEDIGGEFTLTPYGRDWQILCDIREWTLELSAPAVDTTSVAEKWGNAVKSLVTGGGSTEFLIDRKCFEEDQDNGIVLMKLLLMTEKGCKASARFWIMDRGQDCGIDCDLINGVLYYEADILITQTAVNLRPTEIVAGTAQFVTTGEIKLLEGFPVPAKEPRYEPT